MKDYQEFQMVEFPGYFDEYSQEIKEALDLNKGLLRLTHTTIHGVIVATRNLVVKVNQNLEYEIVGFVVKTIRFRTLADFHQSYPDDAIELLRDSMLKLDFDSIFSYEPGDSNRILAPPGFMRPTWQLDYRYKENPTLSVQLIQESGNEYLDIQYGASKYIQATTKSIGFHDPIPEKPELTPLPPPDISTRLGRISELKEKLEILFAKRPIWTRLAIANELGSDVVNHFLFHALPYVAYVFQQGPWRQCWVKYGIDPRIDIQYRIYQIIDVRNPNESARKSHIYDGKNHSCSKTLELVDIIDPDFKQLIQSIVYCRAVCDYRDGWYIEGHLDLIREKIKQGLKLLRKTDVESEEESEEEIAVEKQIQDLLDANDDDYFELLEDI